MLGPMAILWELEPWRQDHTKGARGLPRAAWCKLSQRAQISDRSRSPKGITAPGRRLPKEERKKNTLTSSAHPSFLVRDSHWLNLTNRQWARESGKFRLAPWNSNREGQGTTQRKQANNLPKNRGGEFKQPLSIGSYVQPHLVVKEAQF